VHTFFRGGPPEGTGIVRAMLLAEEFLLLCFDDRTGKKIISSDRIEPALGGALLAELALMERIGITPHSACTAHLSPG
jgi:Golgi phosphoprotein 3 (GPP34)